MKILVLGTSGMLGSTVIRFLSLNSNYDVWGSARSEWVRRYFSNDIANKIITGINLENTDDLNFLLLQIKPQIIINCVGFIKQLEHANDPLYALPINSLLPHRLSKVCELIGARFIHVSTDCVFSGNQGGYVESDISDAVDVYGRSKFLGEVHSPNSITLRTSIIGHELRSANGLICWFLKQENQIKGFSRAIFSGLPTCELARVISEFVIPNPDLMGLYHVAAEPISKYDLLMLVNQEYGKGIEIVKDENLVIDRSLNADRFKLHAGYEVPTWPQLIAEMHAFQIGG